MLRRQFLASAAAGLLPAVSAPPNLLFLMTDQMRFDALSCAGNAMLPTPHLDRLAREGVRFENAMCPFPVCVPSRTGMLTGKSSANTRVRGNVAANDPVNDPGPSFDNLLHDRGYKSQYHGKWHAPYKLARTYDNRVAPVPEEHKQFIAYLDRHVPRRAPRKGELLERFYDRRPYRPYPADTGYADAQAGASESEHTTQGEVIGVIDVPEAHTNTAFTVDRTLQALNEMKDGPFTLTCSIGPPHPPFLAVEPFARMFPFDKMPLPKNFSHDLRWSPYRLRAESMSHYHNAEYVRHLTAAYYAMVRHVDDQIGRVLKRLEELGAARNTLVIFTSDHGEMLGSHGLVSKMVFHEESVHVPLMMRLPGAIKAGTVVSDPVSGLDLFATLLDYLGVRAPARDGDSLRPLIEGRGKAGPGFRVAEWGTRNAPSFMVRTAGWKLMLADSPDSRAVDALYDLRNDPYEMRNLLGDPADRSRYAARAREMKDRLVEWLGRVRSPAIDGVKARRPA
ncbi:MAG: sulfatase-like hydrolase/transferase [Acidobacteria bacterium]|nr:sulfatase-like hydrolase/transferase [Acidobacteriota bacterium]